MDRKDEQEERLTAFIESMKVNQTPFLMKLEKQALADGVPIIRPQTQALIRFLLTAKKPDRILEVGAAVGYSSLFMREYAPAGAGITTIEKDPERARLARENYRAWTEDRLGRVLAGNAAQASVTPEDSAESIAAGSTKSITSGKAGAGIPEPPELLEGDAADILTELEGPYDFIFMDAAKGQYIHFLPDVKRLLSVGGILLSDNILKEGEMLESRFAVTRRNRTIHRRMREYLDALTGDPELTTVVLGTGDGAAMCVKK